MKLGPRELELGLCSWNDHLTGTPLIVLHGLLEQGAAWRWVAERTKRRVFAPDHRGHGLSEHVGTGGFYHFWDYVSDLDLLLERLSPDAPVDLLGHSMGGTVASLYAGSRPERVRRLILVEGLGPPDDEGSVVSRARAFLAGKRSPPRHDPMPDVDAAADRMRRHNPALPPDRARELAERTTRPVPGGVEWTWDPLHRARSPRPFVASHFIRFLAEITAPTLVVSGGRSAFPGVERAQHLRRATQVVVPDAGHLVHLDAPEALAELVEAFLA